MTATRKDSEASTLGNVSWERLQILISEVEAVEKSLVWPMVGYEQEVMGKMRFACRVCGHCPAALLERLKDITGERNE